jgi:hypothetical protein
MREFLLRRLRFASPPVMHFTPLAGLKSKNKNSTDILLTLFFSPTFQTAKDRVKFSESLKEFFDNCLFLSTESVENTNIGRFLIRRFSRIFAKIHRNSPIFRDYFLRIQNKTKGLEFYSENF